MKSHLCSTVCSLISFFFSLKWSDEGGEVWASMGSPMSSYFRSVRLWKQTTNRWGHKLLDTQSTSPTQQVLPFSTPCCSDAVINSKHKRKNILMSHSDGQFMNTNFSMVLSLFWFMLMNWAFICFYFFRFIILETVSNIQVVCKCECHSWSWVLFSAVRVNVRE